MSYELSSRKFDFDQTALYFTNFNFVEKIGVNPSFFNTNLQIDRMSLYGQFTDREKDFLFNFLRLIKPSKVVEFSPCYGYTTAIAYCALKTENVDIEYFQSYEIDTSCFNATKKVIQVLNYDKAEVILGDVLEKMDLEKLKNCDFLLVDSDHNKEFVQKYVDKFFPLLKKGAWVMVHDVFFEPVINGETEVITKYIKDNDIANYFFLPDLMRKFNIEDNGLNMLSNNPSVEKTMTLWFQV